MPSVDRFEIEDEIESDAGWVYTITLSPEGCASSSLRVSLSWHDHDVISRGTAPPSATIAAVCRLLSDHRDLVTRVPGRVDVSTLRRLIRDFDRDVQSRIGPADPMGG